MKPPQGGPKIAAADQYRRTVPQGFRQGFLQDMQAGALRRTANENDLHAALVKTLGEPQPVTQRPAIQAEPRRYTQTHTVELRGPLREWRKAGVDIGIWN